MIVEISVLMYAACPTGEHPGSVRGYLNGFGHKEIPYPLQYDCGCKDPREK